VAIGTGIYTHVDVQILRTVTT